KDIEVLETDEEHQLRKDSTSSIEHEATHLSEGDKMKNNRRQSEEKTKQVEEDAQQQMKVRKISSGNESSSLHEMQRDISAANAAFKTEQQIVPQDPNDK